MSKLKIISILGIILGHAYFFNSIVIPEYQALNPNIGLIFIKMIVNFKVGGSMILLTAKSFY